MKNFQLSHENPRKNKEITKGTNLWDVRIFQKDLLFITGIPKNLAKEEVLIKNEFLG